MEKEEALVVLNDDQKEVVLRRSKDLYFAIKQLSDWVQSGSLTEEMKETLPSLATHHLSDIKKQLGVTGEESDRIKEMTRSLNKAREDHIAELEKMVDNQNSLLVVRQQLKSIGEKIHQWWKDKGFNYINELKFSENGNIIVNFGFMLDSLSLRYSDTPHSDKKTAKDKIQDFVDQGYIFAKDKHSDDDKNLIDCDANRKLLTDLIQSTFPSAKIIKWENHLHMQKGPDENKHTLRYFEIYIYNYEDIENL